MLLAWLRRLGLATRLTIATVALLVPIYLILLAGYAAGVREQRSAEIGDSVVIGQMAAAVVDGFRRDLEGTLLAAGLALGDRARPVDQDNVGPYLDGLARAYPMLRALFLTNVDGQVIASQAGTGVGADISGRPYIVALQRGAQTVWSGGLAGLQSGQTTIAYARAVRGIDGPLRGFLIAAFQPQAVVERLPITLATDASMVLADEHGRVLYASNPTQLGDLDDIGQVPLVQAALAGTTVRLDGDTVPFAEGPQYGALVPVGASGWVVGYTRPVAALESALRERLIQQALAVTLVMLLAAGGIAYLTRRLLRPLRTLVGAATAVAGGERATVGLTEGDADVLALASAMDAMSQAVAERADALRDEARVVDTLRRIGETLAAELDLEKLVHAATDAATEVTGAEFGAFFYNVDDDAGGAYTLYGLAGAPADASDTFPTLRETQLFAATFRGEGVIRLPDVTRDARYALDGDLPPEQRPIRSYLAVPVVSRSGEVLGGLFFGHSRTDVFTERAERLARGIAAQAAIAIDNAQLYRQSQEAVRLRDEFLSIASHELRTPLAAIKTTAQSALRAHGRGALDENRMSRSFGTIARATDHVARLASDLLDVARLRTGNMSLDRQPIDCAALLERAVAAFHDQSETRRTVEVDQAPSKLEIFGDADRIEQVLANLLDNAAKYSPDGAPISVTALRDGGGVRISVTDRGIGLPENAGERLFQPFGRASNAVSQHIPGLGLGLYICRQIVESHGGRIWLESPGEGEGSTFHVWLPGLPAA